MEQIRISSEQIEADNAFLNQLEQSLKDWQNELEWTEKELIDQALIDAKVGARSNRYTALETREKELREMIKEAERKLGMVEQRYNVGSLRDLVNKSLNLIRP
jgi:DNA repair exonuclease SbcCD ATPase subunit